MLLYLCVLLTFSSELQSLPLRHDLTPLPSLTQILGVGARVWGAIIEVSERELVVSMPHGLRGHVPAAAAGEPGVGVDLLAAFNIGQLVRAQITQLTGAEAGEDGAVPPEDGKKRRKKVYLTLAPSAVNAGLGGWRSGFCTRNWREVGGEGGGTIIQLVEHALALTLAGSGQQPGVRVPLAGNLMSR